jgi:hypothetical protein
MRDPYKALGIPRSATAEDIKGCFRRRVKKLHPDINKSPEAALQLAELNFAYEILSDREKRRAFDLGEIDAEGKPKRRQISYAKRVVLSVIALSIPAALLLVRGAAPLQGINATNDSKHVVSRYIVGDEPAPTEEIGRPEAHLVVQQDISRAADDTIPLDVQVSGETVERLVERGLELLAKGDVVSGRLLLQRAAEAHDARAALALGATYDPVMLARLPAYGVPADTSLARDWYLKAREFGSPEAQRRLNLLVKGAGDAAISAEANNVVATRTPIDRNVAGSLLDHRQIEWFVGRGQELLAKGDVVSGRLLLQRAAEAHDARAALALGASYDPATLAELPAYGVPADTSLARNWYLKALEFGSSEAQQRLNLLAALTP